EADERSGAIRLGAGGAKGGGRGEDAPAKRVPDTGPGRRVTGAGAHTASRNASPSITRGGSRMRESRPYGSVRGALSNERPYRDFSFHLVCFSFPWLWISFLPGWDDLATRSSVREADGAVRARVFLARPLTAYAKLFRSTGAGRGGKRHVRARRRKRRRGRPTGLPSRADRQFRPASHPARHP